MPLISKAFSDLITFSRTGGNATYFAANGVLTTAANNEPRFDYDPATFLPRGLLIEEARTNLYTYSQQIQNTIGLWSVVRGSTIANAINGLDGTLSASKLQEDTTVSNSHYVYQISASYTSGTTYTQSVYVKAAGRTQIQMSFPSTAFTTEQRVLYDLTAVTATTQSGTPTSSITSVGNGWYRCVITAAATATIAANTILVYLYNGSLNYTGDGTSGVYLWGAQLEAGAFPTSYIPTTVAQVTRNADQASINTLSPWYNATEGTLFAEYVLNGYTTGTFPCVAQLGVAGIGNRGQQFVVNVSSAQVNFNVYDDAGAYQGVGSPSGPTTLNTVLKAAGTYKANNSAVSFNANAPVTDTTVTLATGINRLAIGQYATLVTPINGYLRRITYYPSRLSNAQLQTITT